MITAHIFYKLLAALFLIIASIAVDVRLMATIGNTLTTNQPKDIEIMDQTVSGSLLKPSSAVESHHSSSSSNINNNKTTASIRSTVLKSFATATEDGQPILISAAINAHVRHQVMEGFGASGAWYTPRLLRRKDASELIDLMFKDLQLDIFRIRNVYQQDDYVQDIVTFATIIAAAESSLGRPIKVLMSGWSPPAWLKSTNRTRRGGTLATEPITGKYRYKDYAHWWADSLDYYHEQDIVVDYLSIQNEPNLRAPHASCVFGPNETADKAGYNKAFEAVYQQISHRRGAGHWNSTSMPKMIGPETASFKRLSNYIDSFVDGSKFYGYAHHLYQDTVGMKPDGLNTFMATVQKKYGDKPLFQTEYSVLKGHNCTAVTRKLNLARLMHNALTIEQVSAYLYWALYWVGEQGLVDISSDGAVYITPEYYAFKHFSAFVHSGWQRIAATTNPADGIALTTFQSSNRGEATVILSNDNSYDVALHLTFHGLEVSRGRVFRSSEVQNCEFVGNFESSSVFVLPRQSVNTLSLDVVPLNFSDSTENRIFISQR